MRQIGSLATPQHARRFTDYLTARGISAVAEQEADGWSIWIRDEDQVDASREALDSFVGNPEGAEFVNAAAEAQRIRADKLRLERELAQKRVAMRQMWSQPLIKRAPLMTSLMVLCVIVYLAIGSLNTRTPTANMLRFFDPGHMAQSDWVDRPTSAFVDIRSGEVWRLLTPIFLHGSLTHIFFNLLCFHSLGSLVEIRHGPARLALITIVSGIMGNVFEELFTGPSPHLGGLSGVVYGLVGYLWIYSVLYPRGGIVMRKEILVIMFVWLALGFSGMLDGLDGKGSMVANYAHLFGMFGGMAVAYGVSLVKGRS
jgi:GlpG protein